MKKLLLVLISLVLVIFTGYSQTKRVAHRSHSGSNATFNLMGEDNFGDPFPHQYWLKLGDSLRTVDSLKSIGVYPYYYQGGEFAKIALKHWGKMILDSLGNKLVPANSDSLHQKTP
ncbi:MAG: hypothetical protein H6581_13130 [Bacteroidia bacterium]|nr:hypothetical protein [Bacteroidia bacterium]